MKTPEDMTIEEIREQLPIYNRLYYYKRRQEEGYMQKKRDSALKCIQKKKLKQYLKDNNINTAIEDLPKSNWQISTAVRIRKDLSMT